MQKVSRSIFAGLLVIAGLTACGDKVTVAGGGTSTSGTPVVHSVTVTPASVQLSVGQTVQLVASVDADAGLARTVTWTSTAPALATVSSSGLVTAVSAGTVAITAASTADATVVGAATIIVAATTPATISISTINQGGVPANLNNVAGQLDVTLNVDQGTQSVTKLYLIAASTTGSLVDTVATYSYTSSSKAPAGNAANATASPITMSFNTAAFTQDSGHVTFLNGSYTIKAAAVVAGSSTQAPVSSNINYTVNNADFIGVKATATNTGSDGNGLQWIGGAFSVNVVPVLYSGLTMKTVTVLPDPADVVAAAQTLSTFPAVAAFSAGTKDTLTYNPFNPNLTAVYSNGSAFAGAITQLSGSLPTPFRIDWMAPAAPATFAMTRNAAATHWINGSYAFGNSTDYKLVAAPTDPGSPSTPGSGAVASKAQFWAFPKASFTALGAVSKSAAKCSTTGATQVTTGAGLAQSLPADSTTYNLRVLQYDNVGNVVCQDLGGVAPVNFGVDLTPPVSAKYLSSKAGTNAGAVNALLKGTHGGYNVGDFTGFQPTAVDSISGFNLATDVKQTVSVNDVTTPATTCSIGAPANGCSALSGAGVLFPATGTGGINDEGYYTIGATISDRAGNADSLAGAVIAIDRTAPVGSGGIAIPAALVGGTAISLTGTVTDNMTLMSGGGSIAYAGGITINYDGSSSFSAAGTFGTLNTSGTATLGVPWFISDLQAGNAAGAGPATFNMRGTDEVGLSGGLSTVIPGANITTGAGTGAGANGEWTAADFTGYTETNIAVAGGVGANAGAGATSVALTANVALPLNVGVPFSQVCFYYQDPKAVTTNATPTFSPEYKQISCVAAPATSDNVNWVYTSGAWTPPTTLPNAAVNIIAIGFGVNGHASVTAVNNTIVVNN